MRKQITFIAAIAISAAVFSATMPVGRLAITGKQFWVRVGESRDALQLSQLSGDDTLRVWDLPSLSLISGADSLFVTAQSQCVPICLDVSGHEQILYIWFASTQTRIDEMAGLLRQFHDFAGVVATPHPNFRYLLDDDNLQKLRQTYRLEEIAGHGSDISRMINLNRWAHSIVRHDGNSPNPSPRDALNLIKVCADSNRGVNCRMMATILNEACLAVGMKSRHLTCMPADTTDPDCHVINMVWSDSLMKWIYLDPTFQGYFTNVDGVMLSPLEVRQAFINGDALVVAADLDYNGQPKPRLEYLAYMAKNLFRFSTPLESACGYETRAGDRAWVYLSPVGYDSTRSVQADTTHRADALLVDHYTTNARWFWQSPQ